MLDFYLHPLYRPSVLKTEPKHSSESLVTICKTLRHHTTEDLTRENMHAPCSLFFMQNTSDGKTMVYLYKFTEYCGKRDFLARTYFVTQLPVKYGWTEGPGSREHFKLFTADTSTGWTDTQARTHKHTQRFDLSSRDLVPQHNFDYNKTCLSKGRN